MGCKILKRVTWPWPRPFKFGLWVNGSKSQPDDDKSSLKGTWSWSRDTFLNFRLFEIYMQRLQLEISNFVHELDTWSISLFMTNCPPSGRGQDHVTHFRLTELYKNDGRVVLFYRATLCYSAVHAMALCLSLSLSVWVCLCMSVTKRCFTVFNTTR